MEGEAGVFGLFDVPGGNPGLDAERDQCVIIARQKRGDLVVVAADRILADVADFTFGKPGGARVLRTEGCCPGQCRLRLGAGNHEHVRDHVGQLGAFRSRREQIAQRVAAVPRRLRRAGIAGAEFR